MTNNRAVTVDGLHNDVKGHLTTIQGGKGHDQDGIVIEPCLVNIQGNNTRSAT